MRVAVASVQVPFIRGGAESLAEGLVGALRREGHEADLVTLPFRFDPPSEVRRAMRVWSEEDFEQLTGRAPDRVICTKFPAYYLQHPRKVVWLIHQHRAVYDLWGTAFDGGLSTTRDGRRLRAEITDGDRKALGACHAVYTIARRVTERLERDCGIASRPLYHPPKLADRLYCAPSQPYVFFPSRLEDLKRQTLLIEAMTRVKAPVVALLAGEGGNRYVLEGLIRTRGLEDRVRLLGHVDEEQMLAYYANSLAVFFGPYDEDYGLVALEALLSGKPLITCTDSGEPREFVRDGLTGAICEPDPAAVAEAIDALAADPERARRLGVAGRELYDALDIRWSHVVDALLG